MATSSDWVVRVTFPTSQDDRQMDAWEERIAPLGGTVAVIPGRPGVHVTVRVAGSNVVDVVSDTVQQLARRLEWFESPYGIEAVPATQWQEPTEIALPSVMTASEIASFLGIRRQRVQQLRSTSGFPLPAGELGGRPFWDAAKVRTFADNWRRKPGRPPRPE
jgi:hypothetical protein